MEEYTGPIIAPSQRPSPNEEYAGKIINPADEYTGPIIKPQAIKSDVESPTAITRNEYVGPIVKRSDTSFLPTADELTSVSSYTKPIKRYLENQGAIASESIESIKKGYNRPISEPFSKTWDIGVGVLSYLYSPISAASKTFVKEPVSGAAKAAGASKETSEFIGESVGLASEFALPFAAVKAVNKTVSAGNESLFKTLEKGAPDEVRVAAQTKIKEAVDKIDDESIKKAKQFLETDLSAVQIPLPGVDRHVNYANYLITTDDAKRAIVAAEKIRGSSKITVPWGETEKLAKESGITISDLLQRGAREGHNATQIEAFKGVVNAASKNVFALRDKILKGSATDADRALFYTQFDELMRIDSQFQGAKGEVARALQVMQKPTEASQQVKTLRDIASGKLVLQNGKKLEDLGVNELAELLGKLDSPEQLLTFVRSASKATTSQAFIEAWKAGLLTGLRTHEVNFLSNFITSVLHIPERLTAAAVGKILPGKEHALFSEIPAQISGAWSGAIEGARLAKETILHGPTAESALKAIDAGKINAIKGSTFGLYGKAGKAVDVAGEVIRTPFRMLSAEDDFFRTIAKRMELHALATRQGISEGLKGKALGERVSEIITNPTPELSAKIEQFGRYSTFNKDLGKAGRAVMDLARSHPALQVVMPFIRTPVNIIKYAGERTPFAIFSQAVRNELRKGGAERDLAIAKMMVGSSISAWTAWATTEGIITGGGPSDRADKMAKYGTGWKPYSIRIGDTYYPYGRFEPAGILLGYAADAAEIMHAAKSDDKAKLGSMIASAVTKNITNKTFLQGISSVINVASDPDRYGEGYVKALTGSLVPTIVAEVAQSQDPMFREINSFMDAIRSRTPGLSKSLYPKRDYFGKPIERHSGGVEAFMAVQPSEKVTDKAYLEIDRLGIGVLPPNKKIAGKEIPPDVYDEYARMSGELAKKWVDKTVHDPRYDNLPRLMKEQLIKGYFQDAKQIARIKLGIETSSMREKIEKERSSMMAK